MKLDLDRPLKNPKGEPFTMAGLTGPGIYQLLKVYRDGGKTIDDALKAIDADVEAKFGGPAKDMLRPMDLGDALYHALEISPLYTNGPAAGKRKRGRLLTKLVARGEVEITEDEEALLKEDYEQPAAFNGALLLAIQDAFDDAKVREVEEHKRVAEGAKLTAVSEEKGATG